ncbi:hypothetical protein GSY74_01035, partial [Sulfurovum sp. bin170]|uniref:hypothetical protein n=1 Tax=Sulfurovum sp. bin170 TaxID=2695268 RepID=UPI0013DF01F9
VDVDKSGDTTTATIKIGDKKVEVAVHDSGTMEGKVELEDKEGNLVTSSIQIELSKSKTSVDAEGNVETTVETDSGATIKTTLGIDGSVGHEVKSKDGVSVAISAIPGSKIEVDKDGNVEITSAIEKDGFIYKAVATTNTKGEIQTKFIKIDVATGKEQEINTLAPTTPYVAGSKAEIVELDDLIYIQTTTPLDGSLIIE